MFDKKDEKLRKKCVDHWFENLMLLQLNHYSNSPLTQQIKHQGGECAFCKVYQTVGSSIESTCSGCPIMLKTGSRFCEDTSWVKINKMMISVITRYSYEKYFACFAAEIDFLLSL